MEAYGAEWIAAVEFNPLVRSRFCSGETAEQALNRAVDWIRRQLPEPDATPERRDEGTELKLEAFKRALDAGEVPLDRLAALPNQ